MFQKFQTFCPFLFSNKLLVFKAGIHKIDVRIANREDPDQTASQKQSALGLLSVCLDHLGLRCFSRPFWQATSVQNFRALILP